MAPTKSPGPRHQRGFWNFLIPAAASIGAALIGGRKAQKGQEAANVASAEQAAKQMEFQERMSSTSYQRGVEDMKAAGLNPMLAYAQGGASSPQGAQAQMQSTTAQLGSNIAGSAQGALNLMQAAETVKQTKANTQLMHATEQKVASETMEHSLNSAALAADIKLKGDQATRTRADADNIQQQILGSIAHSARAQAEFQEMNRRGGFAADVERRKSESRRASYEADISKYGVAEAKATSDFFTSTGQMPRWLQLILGTLRTTAPYSFPRNR